MARFVERQVDQMEKRFPCVIGFEGGENERFAPPEEQEKHQSPASECQNVRGSVRFNEPFPGQNYPAGRRLLSRMM